MLEDYEEIDKRLEDRIKIGRVAYLVISLLPYLPLLFFIRYSYKDINYIGFFLYVFLLLFSSLPLTVIGSFSIIHSFRNGHSKMFWLIATVIAVFLLYWTILFLVYGMLQ